MKILLFARLREVHGSESLEIVDSDCPADVGTLRALIADRAGAEFAEAMRDPNVVCAVNQHVARDDTPVRASDEVAFFPPMTGG